MNERKQQWMISWFSIALFTVGTLGTVLMFMAMNSDLPLEQKGTSGLVALGWKNMLGIFPSLFLNAAFLFLGARLFLKGGTSTLFRNVAGCAALAVALSIFFGSLSKGAGGWIGAHTGEVVTSRAHIALGALVGIVSVFAVAWFAWLRQSSIARPMNAPMRPTIEPVASPKPAPRPLARPVATRMSTPKNAASEEGVTADESAALFPLEEVVTARAAAPVSDPVHHADVVEGAPAMPRSPYPEDLRRKGQIPPGAKPLEAPSAPQTSAASAYRWTAPRTNESDATEPSTAAVVTPLFEADGSVRGSRLLRRVEDDDTTDDEIEPSEAPALAEREDDAGLEVETTLRAEALDAEPEASAQVGLPSPSWEQPALFRPEEGDEEPVDAYGTPLTLVEKLRQARRIAGLERDDVHVVEHLADDTRDSAVELPAVSISSAELGELMDGAGLEEVDVDETDVDEAEAEVEPVRAHAIPRELDEEYAVDEDEDDEGDYADDDVVVVAEPEEEEGESEDEAVLVGVGSESIEHDGIVLAETEDEAIVAVKVESATSDVDDAEDDEDEDADIEEEDEEEDETDEVMGLEDDLEEEEIEEDVEIVVPVFRASAPPTLEPLVLPAVDIAPTPRSEPIQPGLFDAPLPVVQPMQPAAAQAKPTTQPAARIEASTPRIEPATAKAEPTKVEAARTKSESMPTTTEPAPLKFEIKQPKSAPATAKTETAPTKSEPAPLKAEALQAKATSSPTARTSTPAERDVVLQPAAPSNAAKPSSTAAKPATSVKSTSTDTSRPNLLSEIGCLFIERGRVAVSMLQRQYSMDFDAACKVLDDLQEMGLIGPYLGGQRRDILLTREQWLERVSQAGAAR